MQCFFHVFLSFNAYMVRPFTVFICSRCKFYNCPNTFSWLCPLRKTFPRNNPARKPPRNQGISLRLNSFSPARQNACCIWDICIAKKALLFSPSFFRLFWRFNTHGSGHLRQQNGANDGKQNGHAKNYPKFPASHVAVHAPTKRQIDVHPQKPCYQGGNGNQNSDYRQPLYHVVYVVGNYRTKRIHRRL